MSQLDDLQAYVNFELPRKVTLLTNAIVSYDADPNLGGAPAELQSSPLGTLFYEETADKVWIKLGAAGPTDWQELGSGGGGGVTGVFTAEELTFAVDYNDGTAVDPPADTAWSTQAEITAYLAAQGTSNFKHFNACVEATPPFWAHPVNFNLAAGVHRPRVGGEDVDGVASGFGVGDRIFVEAGDLRIHGSTSYTPIVASQAITSYQVASDDPYIDVGPATPFPADNSLRGKYAITDVGDPVVIVSHTTSRLNVQGPVFDGAPAGTTPPTTVIVGRPSTILRNSLDDVSSVGSSAAFTLAAPNNNASASDYVFGAGNATLKDVQIDNWGVTWAFLHQAGPYVLANVLVDYTFQKSILASLGNGRAFQFNDGGNIAVQWLFHCSAYSDPADTALLVKVDEHLYAGSGAEMGLMHCVFIGSEDPIQIISPTTRAVFYDCYVTAIPYQGTDPIIKVFLDAYLGFARGFMPTGLGRINLLEGNIYGPGILLTDGGSVNGTGTPVEIAGVTGGACVRVESGSKLLPTAFKDGGGNTDVGLEIDGTRIDADIDSGMDVTGSAGDVRIEGVVGSYADVSADSPVRTANFNIITRA